METRWSLGVLIGLPVAGLFTLIGLATITIGIILHVHNKGHSDDWMTWVTGIVITVITLGLTALMMYPYGAEYHQWRPYQGEVEQISARLVSSGEGMNQRFVVELSNHSEELSCDDTRCALVKVGDQLDLMCKRHWQYAGVDGYDCNYYQSNSR